MSLVALSGNASGTGKFTIASPNSNTDRTLTLPDATGTILTTATPGVPVNGPAFSAYQSTAQTGITSGSFTKLLFQTEEFDTNSNFSSSTFTPTVAGYYQVSACTYITSTVSVSNLLTSIWKNGATLRFGNYTSTPTGVGELASVVSALIYCNGTTDYLDAYFFWAGAGTSTTAANKERTWFSASLVRAA